MGTENPIKVLKKGLKVLETHIKAKCHDLVSKLATKTIDLRGGRGVA